MRIFCKLGEAPRPLNRTMHSCCFSELLTNMLGCWVRVLVLGQWRWVLILALVGGGPPLQHAAMPHVLK